MHKAWLVAKREYLTNIRRPGFLFGVFGVPLFTFLIIFVVSSVAVDNDRNTERLGAVGYVDDAGILLGDPEMDVEIIRYDDDTVAQTALDAREIAAYFVVPADFVESGAVELVSREETPSALRSAFNAWLVRSLGSEAGISEEIVSRLQAPAELEVLTLNNGRVIRDNGVIGIIFAPILFVMIFLLASQTTSGYLMSGVVEEKGNRIMEILITSVTPFQLLIGKILGLGALGLTQLLIWAIAGVVISRLGQGIDAIAAVDLPPDMAVVAFIYFVLGYFFLASAMASIGAIFGSEQESRQYASIFSLGLAIPFFVFVQFLTEPNSPLVVFLTVFPLTSPVAVILRMGLAEVPAGELVLSIALLALATVFIAWAGSRIFRYTLLMYGKRPTPRELLRVLRSSTGLGTTATGQSEG